MDGHKTPLNQQLSGMLEATNQGVVGSIPASRTISLVVNQRLRRFGT
jgi:hypothetical protein